MMQCLFYIANSWLSTGKDELLETAMALHDAAMKDEYFVKRKLAPNVDFWCVKVDFNLSWRQWLTEYSVSIFCIFVM